MKRKNTQSVSTTIRRISLAATKMLRSKKNLVAVAEIKRQKMKKLVVMQKAKKSIVVVRQKMCKNKRVAAVTRIKRKNTPVAADIMSKVI